MKHRPWQTLLAIDFDRRAVDTYRANFPGVDTRCAPVESLLDELPEADAIVGGPPCQSWSTAGKGKGHDDERDGIPDFCTAVENTRPRMFLMENVSGMMRQRFIGAMQAVYKRMEDAGYVVQVELLDAVSYGVPQFRKRYFWWGIRRDLYDQGVRHCWPKPTHVWPHPEPGGLFGAHHHLLPAVTVGQALGIWYPGCGFPRTAARVNAFQLELQAHGGNDGGEQRVDMPGPTMRSGSLPGCSDILIHEYRWSDAMLEKHPPASPASPAPTIQAKFFKGGAEGLLTIDTKQHRTEQGINEPSGTLAHDDRRHLKHDGLFVRRLSVAECLRLQSGPDDFAWPADITKTAQYRIVGNGWACKVGHVMAQALRKADPESQTLVDLYCGGGLAACGWHGRYWDYEAERSEQEAA